MEPVAMRFGTDKQDGSRRSFFRFVMMSLFMVFLFQISVPMIIYSQLSVVNGRLQDIALTSGLAGNNTAPLYVVTLGQVVDDHIQVLTCWAGAFLLLVSFVLLGCLKLKNLLVSMKSNSTCMHPDHIIWLSKEQTDFIALASRERMRMERMRMSNEGQNPQ